MKLTETHWYRVKIKPGKKTVMVDVSIYCPVSENEGSYEKKAEEIDGVLNNVLDMQWTYIKLATSLLNSIKDCTKVEIRTSENYICCAEAD